MRLEHDKFKEPVGIGGWLLIPLYLLILQPYLHGRLFFTSYAPLLFSADFWLYFNSDYDIFNPAYGILVIFESAMSIVLMAWSVACVYLILKKSPLVRKFCSRYFITCCGYAILDGIVASICISGYQILPDGNGAITVLVSWLSTALWAWYFIKSKRVANTFCRGDRGESVKTAIFTSEEESRLSMLLFRRAGARVLDVAIVIVCAYIVIKIANVESSIFWWLPSWAMYFVILDLIMYTLFGQTLGKRLFGIRVTRLDGQRLTRKEYMVRNGNALFFLGWPIFALYFHSTMRYFWPLCVISVIATFSYQYCKVLSSGSTSYDAVYDIRVIGQKLNGKQLSLAIFALFGICAMLAYIAMG